MLWLIIQQVVEKFSSSESNGLNQKVNCEFLSVDFDCIESVEMTRIEIVVCLLLGAFCCVQITSAAPVADGNNNNVVDEILMRLKQLRQQSEGKESSRT